MFEYFINAQTANHKAKFARSINELNRIIINEASIGAYNYTYEIPSFFTNDDKIVLKDLLINNGFYVREAVKTANTIVIWWDGDNE